MGDALLTAIGVVVGVVAGAFVVLTVVGVVLLRRRARRAASAPLPGRTDAGSELLRADEALRDAVLEVQFAGAQFGEETTRSYAAAIERSRAELREAFRLQQRLDDEAAAGERRRREWAKQVRAIAERTRVTLDAERRRFEELRGAEAAAPRTIERLRTSLADARRAREAAASESAALRRDYADHLIDPIADNPDDAARELDLAENALADAERAVATRSVTAVTGSLGAARDAIARAESLAGAVSHRRTELEEADSAVTRLRSECEARLAEARALRDAPPDPESSEAVGAAIAALERELATTRPREGRDPIASLDALVDASDALDVAVAAARNQQRRLDGARDALAGALVSARTQIAAVTDYIGSRRGRVGVGARTRLAEAERQLLLAENEADPVAALDAARRAQTHARDADALARYDG